MRLLVTSTSMQTLEELPFVAGNAGLDFVNTAELRGHPEAGDVIATAADLRRWGQRYGLLSDVSAHDAGADELRTRDRGPRTALRRVRRPESEAARHHQHSSTSWLRSPSPPTQRPSCAAATRVRSSGGGDATNCRRSATPLSPTPCSYWRSLRRPASSSARATGAAGCSWTPPSAATAAGVRCASAARRPRTIAVASSAGNRPDSRRFAMPAEQCCDAVTARLEYAEGWRDRREGLSARARHRELDHI